MSLANQPDAPGLHQAAARFGRSPALRSSAVRFSEVDDRLLVLKVQAGNHDALQVIYFRHAKPVYAVALRLLRDRPMAEDLVQAIFLGIWEHPERYDPGRGSLRTYLITLTRGRAIDVVRSNVRRVQREQNRCRSMPTSNDRLDLYSPQNVSALRPALEQLPFDQRTAVEYAYFNGLTYRQTAVALALPEGTVKARIRLGLRRLRHLVATS